jgi:hypothetical protein
VIFQKVHQRLGTAGFVISIVALFAALGGGAYAASGGLSGKQKKEVEKIAKKYAGKPGKAGAPGTAGATGPKGDTGAKGDAGGAGANGSTGTAGANGVSVTSKTVVVGNAKCPAGGSEFTSSTGTTFACNGTTGFASELPAGQTETGAWSTDQVTEEQFLGLAPISFPFALPEGEEVGVEPGETDISIVFEKAVEHPTPSTDCPGSVNEPLAEPGFMCVYEAGVEENETLKYALGKNPDQNSSGTSAGRHGAVLFFEGEGRAYGTWAVTANE